MGDRIETVDVAALFERWGWSDDEPPTIGRVADRLSDIADTLRAGRSGDALGELDSLRASLDAWDAKTIGAYKHETQA